MSFVDAFGRKQLRLLRAPTIAVVLLAGSLVLWGCTARTTATSSSSGPNGGPTPLPAVKADTRVIADGYVEPVRSADLSFAATGTVAEVFVAEGDSVDEGALLVRLNSARQQASVAQAQADVQRAQARLDQVKAGSRVQEIDGARAAVDVARSKVDALKTGPSTAEIAIAQANVAQAVAVLAKAQTGANADELAAAKAEMNNADAQRRLAQAEYDRVGDLPGAGASPQALQLEKATNEYEVAKARYDNLLRGPNPADVASAKAQLDRVKAELEAKKAPPRVADVSAAEAEVRRAQSQLDLLLAGPQPEELLAAEADVAAAQAALALAEAVLAETELRAPFAGDVASVDVGIGQQVNPGTSAIQLGDFSSWLIQTRDLTELRVVGVRPGDRALTTFDAIPGLELSGQVTRIRSIGQNTQGDITYTVVIEPDADDDRLLWNMTAKVVIEPGSGSGQVTGAAATRVARRPVAPTEPPRTATVVGASQGLNPTTRPQPSATPSLAPQPIPMISATAVSTVSPVPSVLAPTRRVAAATQTPPSAAVVSPPALVEPQDGASLKGSVVFKWQAVSPLPSGAFYEVVWWSAGEGPGDARGLAAPTTKTSASVNIDIMLTSGQLQGSRLNWTVLIVRKDPYTRLTQATTDQARLLVWGGPPPTLPPKPRG